MLTNLEITNKISFTPLFILNSGLKFSQNQHEVMGEIDIYPTILNLMGLNTYFWKGIGNSLFSTQPPTFAINKNLKIIGDTTNNSTINIEHKKNSWTISDLMIRKKYFDNNKKNERTN